MVSADALIRAGCKYLGTPYSTIDCQAFVEKALSDCGNRTNLAGSNAWYRRMTWTGTPEECRTKFGSIPAGAFLFILKASGNEPERYKGDGIGNASHIGIYTAMSGRQMVAAATAAGNEVASSWDFGDGAIHSSSSRAHVATSTFSGHTIPGGWNRVGLWKEIDYGPAVNAILAGSSGTNTPGSGADPGKGGKTMEAIVSAANGAPVNLRYYASQSAALITRIPVGKTVEVLNKGTEWCLVAYTDETGKTTTGYMMSSFLRFADVNTDIQRTYTLTFSATEEEAQRLLTIFDAMVQQLESQAGRG